MQAPPPVPHVAPAVPPTHMFAVEQQPPLHPVEPVPHTAEHTWLVVLHAWLAGQSVAALQPHDPLARHAVPAALPVQSRHTVPLPPHWVWIVPDWHVPVAALEQQPVGHGSLELHAKVQIPPEQPCAPGPQSLTEAQPHCPPRGIGSHACPCVLAAQVLHAPPLLPHWVPDVPATQVVPAQHPPLHGWVAALHVVVQRRVVVSHAIPSGQSASVSHPQNVEPPLVTHCPPLGLEAQLAHAGAALVVLHTAAVLPAAQTPALQQPPLHTRFPVHDVEHVWATGSHACPTRQSVGFVQPAPPSVAPLSPGAPESGGDASTASEPASSGGWYAPSAAASIVTSAPTEASRGAPIPLRSSPHAGATSAGTSAHARRATIRFIPPFTVPWSFEADERARDVLRRGDRRGRLPGATPLLIP